jgi:hypothetical protein
VAAAARRPTVVGGGAAAVKPLFYYFFGFLLISSTLLPYPPLFLHSNLDLNEKGMYYTFVASDPSWLVI